MMQPHECQNYLRVNLRECNFAVCSFKIEVGINSHFNH